MAVSLRWVFSTLVSLLFIPTNPVGCAEGRHAEQGNPSWTEPFRPFKLADNLYYVGSKGLASYLVTTSSGHILINSNLEESVPQIRASVETLGFRFNDIKVILISHAHWDHCAGSAAIKRMTSAKYFVMEGDVPVVESGGKDDFQYGGSASTHFPAAKVDRTLKDGDKVTLGNVTLTARLTAGHTKGCTTWILETKLDGKKVLAVIIGSPNVNSGYALVGNTKYPAIAHDFERTFRSLKTLQCDLFLGAHGDYYNLVAKEQKARNGDKMAFVDAAGYRAYVGEREQAFRIELDRQKAKSR